LHRRSYRKSEAGASEAFRGGNVAGARAMVQQNASAARSRAMPMPIAGSPGRNADDCASHYRSRMIKSRGANHRWVTTMIDPDSAFSFVSMQVDYDQRTRELVVTWGEETCIHCAVPPSVYHDLMKAEARGAFYLDRVRDAYPRVPSRTRRRA
jgi:hypothetical protein